MPVVDMRRMRGPGLCVRLETLCRREKSVRSVRKRYWSRSGIERARLAWVGCAWLPAREKISNMKDCVCACTRIATLAQSHREPTPWTQ